MEQLFKQFKKNMKKQVLYFDITYPKNIKTLFGYREGIMTTIEILELNESKDDTTILDMFHLLKLGYAQAIRTPLKNEACYFFNTKKDYDKGIFLVSSLQKIKYEFHTSTLFEPKNGSFVYRQCIPKNLSYLTFEELCI